MEVHVAKQLTAKKTESAGKDQIPTETICTYLPNPVLQTGCNTRSISKRSTAGFEFRIFFLPDWLPSKD